MPRRRRSLIIGLLTAVGIATAFALGITIARVGGLGSDDLRGHTFYVNPDGNDASDGTSTDRAWRTLDRVSKQRLEPGDRVLLAGRLTGTLSIGLGEAGDAANPVVIDSYGQARAAIVSDLGIEVRDTAGITIRNLGIFGSSNGAQDTGVRLNASAAIKSRLAGITLENLDVSGFENGIAVGADGSAGFADVVMSNLASHNNRNNGVAVFGATPDYAHPSYAHTRVTITGVMAYDNTGSRNNTDHNTGSGIVIGSVDTGRIALSTAYSNGKQAGNMREGPLGIWAYDSTRVIIEHSVSYSNRTLGADGGGFGLDQSTTDSMIQYNLSYDNSGEGFLLFGQRTNGSNTRNAVRYNISVNDSRNGYMGAITLVGGSGIGDDDGRISDAVIYQNTVVINDPTPPTPALLVIGAVERTKVANNILAGPVALVNRQPATDVTLAGNFYYSWGAKLVQWGDTDFATLEQFRAATESERLNGTATGLQGSPQLVAPSLPTAIGRATQLDKATGFAPQAGSALIDGGVALPAAGVTDPGGRDFLGTVVDSARSGIGAITG